MDGKVNKTCNLAIFNPQAVPGLNHTAVLLEKHEMLVRILIKLAFCGTSEISKHTGHMFLIVGVWRGEHM